MASGLRNTAIGVVSATALIFTGTSNADIYTRVLNQHPALARSMCKQYNKLLNLGWSDGNIYEVLHDAGAASNRTEFNAIVRWCFSH